jgi:hypothetical protein
MARAIGPRERIIGGRTARLARFHRMQDRTRDWKASAEALWSARNFPFREAAQLTMEIGQHSGDPELMQVARQAAPSLRAACAAGADRARRAVAQRRFGLVVNALRTATAPTFGRRRQAPPPQPASPAEAVHRRLLGLPPAGALAATEIRQAYKRAARKAHPDTGGDGDAFVALVTARDALLKRV